MSHHHDAQPGPGTPSPIAVSVLRRYLLPVLRLAFRPTIDGLHHLPQDGPYLLVANHNAGLGLAEILCFAALWADTFGDSRPLAGYAHPVGFRIWPITALHRLVGTIPSTYEAAYQTLEGRVPILMFPGGDFETLRPVWQANLVDFGGRKGFLRIASTAGVTIVPMGIQGSHYTAPMLFRSKLLAWFFVLPRLLGIKRWGLSVLGIMGVILIAALPIDLWIRLPLAFVWLASPLILLPWIPWTIRFRIGVPMPSFDSNDPSEIDLDRALKDVESRVAGLLSNEMLSHDPSPK
jgi:1-acyl-sn-glycerol-3-phosphate acyltransferase